MDLGRDITKTYPMDVDTSAQNVAYALAEFLDFKELNEYAFDEDEEE